MPSSEQLAYIEQGVGLWARLTAKVNLLFLAVAWEVWHER
jgi:hypothetical protein